MQIVQVPGFYVVPRCFCFVLITAPERCVTTECGSTELVPSLTTAARGGRDTLMRCACGL